MVSFDTLYTRVDNLIIFNTDMFWLIIRGNWLAFLLCLMVVGLVSMYIYELYVKKESHVKKTSTKFSRKSN